MPDNGSLEKVDGRWQLRFTRKLRHRPEKVWRALTEPEHVAAWFPTDIHGERAAGAALRFTFREGEQEGPPMDGEMVVYDPPTALEFTWGEETLRFDLRPDGEGTVLEFVDTFDELGKAARDGAGWHECLDLLACHLNGEDPPAAGVVWKRVHPDYVERFGPEASTIGPPDWYEGA